MWLVTINLSCSSRSLNKLGSNISVIVPLVCLFCFPDVKVCSSVHPQLDNGVTQSSESSKQFAVNPGLCFTVPSALVEQAESSLLIDTGGSYGDLKACYWPRAALERGDELLGKPPGRPGSSSLVLPSVTVFPTLPHFLNRHLPVIIASFSVVAQMSDPKPSKRS